MSIAEFSSTIQSEVFKKWLSKLDKNIVNATVSDIRKKEQVAAKTDFILSVKNVREMYKNVTSKEISNSVARRVLRDIASAGKLDVPAKVIRLGGSGALMFESIGFDTISKYVTEVFDNLDGVRDAYSAASDEYLKTRMRKISESTFKDLAARRSEEEKARKAADNIGFGYFLHKGHVVSLATNSAKTFKESVISANEITASQKEVLLTVLDSYISKLEKDDLASANLPNAYKQQVYAKYIKSPEKYLVEIQLKSDNLESGSASLPITNELRKAFSASGKELEGLLLNSPALGKKLLTTKGSPSMLDLIVADVVSKITGKAMKTREYVQALTKIGESSRKVVVKNNKKDIAALKALKAKTKAIPLVKTPKILDEVSSRVNLASLMAYINSNLQNVVSANMGNGNDSRVLNYRTGRFAASAAVERLSESRQGMLTAFYSYMKNPYATFEPGGKQGSPKSRDPKLLLSSSIREIAATKVSNQLRAISV
jgi:hypothetical protein